MLKILLAALIEFVNLIVKIFGYLIGLIFLLLPPSPFQQITASPIVSEYMDRLNYILPISESLAVFQLWIAAVTIYYLYSVILRWIKAVQ